MADRDRDKADRSKVDLVADHLCKQWSSMMGGVHIHTEDGCAMHRRIARSALEVMVPDGRPKMNDYLLQYVEARGIEMPHYDSGSKITEEAEELREAVRKRDLNGIMDETADLAIVASVAASQFGFTVEEALERKIAKDTGRGPKPGER